MSAEPNWCRTCGKHRNDSQAVFCTDPIHKPAHVSEPAYTKADDLLHTIGSVEHPDAASGEGHRLLAMLRKQVENPVASGEEYDGAEGFVCVSTSDAHALIRRLTTTDHIADAGKKVAGQGDVEWQPIETLGCNDGVVLLYSAQWVDADFNPEGIREGFRNEGPGGPVLSARWCASHDLWETDEQSGATHWRKRPAAPFGQQQEGQG